MNGNRNRKRILYICSDIKSIGGIQKYNSDFISSISKKIYELKIIQRVNGGYFTKIKFFYNFLFEFIKFRPNHIICSHINFSPLVMLAYLFRKTEFSLTFYGIDALNITNFFHKQAIKLSKSIVVISEYTKSLIFEQFPICEHKLYMLKSSVDPDKFTFYSSKETLKKKYNLEKSEIILTLSRLASNEDKGQHRVLASLEEVIKVFPKARYIIAGPGQDIRVDNFLADNPNISNSVIRLNNITDEEKNKFYSMCDVFILPSKTEGFGIVFIEALICGAVVIAPNDYGCPEALDNGKLGLIVNPDDTNEISLTIIQGIKKSKKMSESDRLLLRKKTIQVFGRNKWNKSVNKFLNQTIKI